MRGNLMGIRNQRGDTLVEVLLAIAVLASVIGIAYGTTTRAQRGSQLAQERAEAMTHAQTQAERLRRIRDSINGDDQPNRFIAFFGTNLNPITAPNGFCLPNVSPIPVGTDIVAGDNAACTVNGRYARRITYTAAQRRFTILVTWTAAGGGPLQTVSLESRIW